MAPSQGSNSLQATAPPRNLHQTLARHKGPVHVARYAKGAAKYVLTGGQDRTVRLWNPHLGTEIKAFEAHGYEVLGITVSHDNAKFGSCGGDRSVFLWDVTTGMTIRRFAGHMGKVNAVEFNEDATVLASGQVHSTPASQTRSPIQVLDQARDAVQTLHVGPHTITTGSVDGHVRVYDLRMGQLRSDYIGDPITSILPTADAQTLLVVSLDGAVRLMDLSTGKQLNAFKGHQHTAYRLRACFGHAEASILCGDEEGRVWAWDLLDAKAIPPTPPPKVHDKTITWVEHHPTEQEMITASADGTVKVWRVPGATE